MFWIFSHACCFFSFFFSSWRHQKKESNVNSMRNLMKYQSSIKFLVERKWWKWRRPLWNIPHGRFLLEKAVRPFAESMSSHVEQSWICSKIVENRWKSLKLRPTWNMLVTVCHVLSLFSACVKFRDLLKIWGPLCATLCGSSKSGTSRNRTTGN